MELKFTVGFLALARLVASSDPLAVTTTGDTGQTVEAAAKLNAVPNTYIIELQPDSGTRSDASATDSFARTMGDASSFEARHDFRSKYFRGLSATFGDDVDMASLKRREGVKNVWPVPQIPRPNPFGLPAGSRRAATLRGRAAAGGNQTTLPNYRGDVRVNNPLNMSNVQQLHEKGVKGKGIQVAVIDSGVDYNHPSLGGGFGAGYKVSMGYDFVGDDYDGTNAPVPDDDPIDNCPDSGHGTHCAGIIAMQDPEDQGFGLVGVAPEATIAAYRVFSCSGSTSADVVLAAMLRAADDGADVISMSLGIPNFWELTNPFETLVGQLADDGVLVAAALGNDGRLGPYGTSAPGLSTAALSVGSVENDVFPTSYLARGGGGEGEGEELAYVSVFPVSAARDFDFEIYKLGTGYQGPPPIDGFTCSEEAWQAAQDASVNWNETVLLLPLQKRCATGPFEAYAEELGVRRAVFYLETDDVDISVAAPGQAAQAVFLDRANSKKLLRGVDAQGGKYRLRFDGAENSHLPNPLGSTVSSFSSFGPSVEMTLSPKVSAPGGKILSTFPLAAGGYAVLSGTSMAAPFAAGAYALLKTQHPDLALPELLGLLQSTAGSVKEHGSDIVSSAARQGSGLIDAAAAVDTRTVISPTELSLRDSAEPAPQKIRIENRSKKAKSYTVEHEPAAFHRVYNNYLGGNASNLEFDDSVIALPVYADADISEPSFSLAAGESTTIEVKITPPAEKYPYSSPLYSGFLRVTEDGSDDGFSYSIPYLGVPFDQYDVGPVAKNVSSDLVHDVPAVLSFNSSNYLISLAEPTQPNLDSYHWPKTPNDTQKVPLLRIDIPLPSLFSRVDLVPANISFQPDHYGFDPSVEIKYQHSDTPVYEGFLGVPTHGIIYEAGVGPLPVDDPAPAKQLFAFPQFVSSVLSTTVWDEHMREVNFTSGDYRPLLRSLRWGGNATDADDYESWLGPVIRATV